MFGELHMHETELRNGVIVYVAIKDHKLAVWGDEGIHKKVGQNFWDDILATVQKYFNAKDYETGLSEAILMIGDKLKEYFPYQSDDVNELSDDISYGDSRCVNSSSPFSLSLYQFWLIVKILIFYPANQQEW